MLVQFTYGVLDTIANRPVFLMATSKTKKQNKTKQKKGDVLKVGDEKTRIRDAEKSLSRER